jgi:hypothetical protein
MYPSKSAKPAEFPFHKFRLVEDKIVFLKPKMNSPQTLSDVKDLFVEIKKISKGQKRCILMDLTNYQLPSREVREYEAKELPTLATAIAIVSKSMYGAYVARIFLAHAKQPYPIKIFTDEPEAKEWLKQYLPND